MNTGYLYFIENNALQCRDIRLSKDYPKNSTLEYLFPDGVYDISTQPGVFYNNTVWLKEKDDATAIGMFLHYSAVELDMAAKKFNSIVEILKRGVK